jgi:glucose-1-phosphate thymidylyltransferase
MSESRRLTAIVPACGRATRLTPYPSPKELFPIGWQDIDVNGRVERRPKVVSEFLVESLLRAKPETLLVVVGIGKQDLTAYYTPPRFPPNIAFVYRESTPSMVHSIDAARVWTRDSTVMFGMPDTIVEPEDAFVRLLAHHRDRGAVLTLGVFPTDEPHRFGTVDLGSDGRIVGHFDKPASTHLRTMWGIAVWEPAFTELLHALASRTSRQDREVVFGDAIDQALSLGWPVHGLEFEDGQYIDIGSDAGIRKALLAYSV